MLKSQLDSFAGAYGKNFKFYEENMLYLTKYSNFIWLALKNKCIKNVLSLGIGHKVVCDRLLGIVGDLSATYNIVEGSDRIISEFKSIYKNKLHLNVQIHHERFESFRSTTKFDAIEMGFVLEHVVNPADLLVRYQDLLAPSGILFIAVPNARSLHRLIGYKAGLLDDLYRLSPYDVQLGHQHYFDLASISDLVIKSGLKITKVHGLMLKPITIEQMHQLGWDEHIFSALMDLGADLPEISNCIYIEAMNP